MDAVGRRRWAIDAHVEITVFFADREPAGPYLVVVPARRTDALLSTIAFPG